MMSTHDIHPLPEAGVLDEEPEVVSDANKLKNIISFSLRLFSEFL